MIIKTTNEITNGVFSTVITVERFGSEEFSSDEELNILNNYSCRLRYKDLDFSRKFNVVDNKLNMLPEETDESGEYVKLIVTDMLIPMNENFKAEYKIGLKQIKDEEIGDILSTKEMICEARCMTFADVVKEGLKAILNDVRAKSTGFEGSVEEMI